MRRLILGVVAAGWLLVGLGCDTNKGPTGPDTDTPRPTGLQRPSTIPPPPPPPPPPPGTSR